MSISTALDESQVNGEGDSREFRILIASDIHLGFADRCTERRTDSINSFEEVLQVRLKRARLSFAQLSLSLFLLSV